MATVPASVIVATMVGRGVSAEHRAGSEAEWWEGLATCAARQAVACSWEHASATSSWVTLPPKFVACLFVALNELKIGLHR